jgi:hypothetical protein
MTQAVRRSDTLARLFALSAMFAVLPLAALRADTATPGADPASATYPLEGGRVLTVAVPADEPAEAGTVEIVIQEAGVVLTRLSTRRLGELSASWVTDLDGDDEFEVVLNFDGTALGLGNSLQVWEWSTVRHAFGYQNLPPIETEEPELAGRFMVEDDELLWVSAAPDAAAAVFRFEAKDQRWKPERDWLPWLGSRLGL